MQNDYLHQLDERLAVGAKLLGPRFGRARVDFVRARQMPDGGFAGRLGGSDVYYTDFALRTLTLLEPDGDALRRAAVYVRSIGGNPATVAECFNRLNCARMLADAGVIVEVEADPILDRLRNAGATAYDLFLSALCHDMLDAAFPERNDAIGGLLEMLDRAGDDLQTNDAAAAVGFLMMHTALDQPVAEAVTDAIASMQAPAGGFRAHREAPEPDLLSTFSALVTLAASHALDRVDLAEAGRFVRSLAAPDGGFRSCAADEEMDVEYTYCGVASAALLKGHVATRPPPKRTAGACKPPGRAIE
jgi:geranylgeranyl transferase type-2 subunit beta